MIKFIRDGVINVIEIKYKIYESEFYVIKISDYFKGGELAVTFKPKYYYAPQIILAPAHPENMVFSYDIFPSFCKEEFDEFYESIKEIKQDIDDIYEFFQNKENLII